MTVEQPVKMNPRKPTLCTCCGKNKEPRMEVWMGLVLTICPLCEIRHYASPFDVDRDDGSIGEHRCQKCYSKERTNN